MSDGELSEEHQRRLSALAHELDDLRRAGYPDHHPEVVGRHNEFNRILADHINASTESDSRVAAETIENLRAGRELTREQRELFDQQLRNAGAESHRGEMEEELLRERRDAARAEREAAESERTAREAEREAAEHESSASDTARDAASETAGAARAAESSAAAESAAAGAAGGGARGAVAGAAGATAGAARSALTKSGIGILPAVADIVDAVPFVGDFPVLIINILQVIRAFFAGHIGTSFLMAIVTAIDFGVGFALDAIPIFGPIADIFFVSTIINQWLFINAEASRRRNEMSSSWEEEDTSFLIDNNGNPTFAAIFFALIGFALPVYGLWMGEYLYILIGVVTLVMIAMTEEFRDEFFSGIGILFLVTLAIHIFYHAGLFGGAGLGLSTGMIVINAMIYLVIGVFYFFLADEQQKLKKAAVMAMAAIFFYSLPGMFELWIGGDGIKTAVVFLVVAIPIWPIMLASQVSHNYPQGFMAKIVNLWILSLVVIGLIYSLSWMITVTPQLPEIDSPDVDTQGRLAQATATIRDRFDHIVNFFPSLYARAQNPQTYYSGKVEDSEQIPMGVEITEVRALEENIPTGTEIIVYGTVRARPVDSDLFKDPRVTVIPACILDRSDPVAGDPDVASIDLVWGQSGQFACTFPPQEKTGSIAAKLSVTFPFETWSYIPYTFVGRERAEQLALRGEDLHRTLGIDEKPPAIFTNGPVKLGMAGVPQPIIIDPQADPMLSEGTKVGITLDPNWREGELKQVNRMQLRVPEPFFLEECDREPQDPVPDENDPLLRVYTFENPQSDAFTGFASVTCSLRLDDQEYAAQIAAADKSTLSFVGSAFYEYSIEETERVRVR